MKTAVVILNWNTEGFLKEFLPGLIDSVSKVSGAEVIVADNASTDGSLKVMQEMFPHVRTIAFDRNYGFTGGYNKAFSEIESDLFVLINSDIEVTEDWLTPLVEWMQEHPECGACAPKGQIRIRRCGRRLYRHVRISFLQRTYTQPSGD